MLEQSACLAAFAAGDDLRDVAKKFNTDFTWSIICTEKLGIFITAKLGTMESHFLDLTPTTTAEEIKVFIDGIIDDYESSVDTQTTARIKELTEELHKLREFQARRAAR